MATVDSHRAAVNHDLMTLTPYTLDDVGVSLSWHDVHDFLSFLPPSSALYRELHPDTARFSDGEACAYILADIFDLLNMLRHERARSRTAPKPYARPWEQKKDVQQFGKDPIPVSEFDAWWERATRKED